MASTSGETKVNVQSKILHGCFTVLSLNRTLTFWTLESDASDLKMYIENKVPVSAYRSQADRGAERIHVADTPTAAVLKDCKDVELYFSDLTQKNDAFKGTKKGLVFLTPYRVIFVSKGQDSMRSFMMPFYLIKGCSIEQPVFAANFIKGTIVAEAGASRGGPPPPSSSQACGYGPAPMMSRYGPGSAPYGPSPAGFPVSYGYQYPSPPPAQNGYYMPPQQAPMGYPYAPPPQAGEQKGQ
ncbi:WBP2 protein, partial [Polypterus senegalus]